MFNLLIMTTQYDTEITEIWKDILGFPRPRFLHSIRCVYGYCLSSRQGTRDSCLSWPQQIPGAGSRTHHIPCFLSRHRASLHIPIRRTSCAPHRHCRAVQHTYHPQDAVRVEWTRSPPMEQAHRAAVEQARGTAVEPARCPPVGEARYPANNGSGCEDRALSFSCHTGIHPLL